MDKPADDAPAPRIPDIEGLPALAAALGRHGDRFRRCLDVLCRHVPQGRIANADYEGIRSGLMDGLSEAWNAGIPAALMQVARAGGDHRAATYEGSVENKAHKLRYELDMSSYQGTKVVRTISQRLGTALLREQPAPIAEALRGGTELLAEIRAVTDAMDWLKARAVKRNAPGSAPPEPVLPAATLAAQAEVRVRMRDVLGDLRAQYAEVCAKRARRDGAEMVRECGKLAATIGEIREEARQDRLAGREPMWRERPGMRMQKARILELWRRGRTVAEYDPNTFAITPHADADVRVAAHAASQTERVFHLWTERNVEKLSPLVEEKGGVAIEVLSASASDMGVQSRMAVTFPDGSAFTYTNGIETAVSTRGREFERYPARFHDVTMPDGTRIKGPSEARVREALLGESGAAPAPRP